MKRKILTYLIIFILIIFVLPALLTKRTLNVSNLIIKKEASDSSTNEDDNKENSLKNYDYQKYATIKLLHQDTGEIEELPIDQYLYGVVSAEMPANYEMEALKAQALVARTYTIYQISKGSKKHEGTDICDKSTCCQAWISKEDRFAKWSEEEREENWKKIEKAVGETSGKIITYNGEPIDAFFHANSGGKTESASNVWGGENFPYLQSVETSGEDGYSGYNTELTLSKDELKNKLKQEYPNIEINLQNTDEIKILEYTESGRVRTIKIGNTNVAGTKLRSCLGLRSTFFDVKIEGENITFNVIGYGHGVGMSQTGADSLAKQGYSAEEIVKHFYTGVEIQDIWNFLPISYWQNPKKYII